MRRDLRRYAAGRGGGTRRERPLCQGRAGKIANFTGISSAYEAPERPDIRIDTLRESPEAAAERIVGHIMGVWSPDL
ncbi:adenylyl-sulfate kinase [Sphingomonas sp. Ant H11]|uniref:adenylyl-sulfate kinase n=1 Tax=Sphingomonas sp. Ant H11 TaxID=1564113 RepID=UPI003FA6DDCA